MIIDIGYHKLRNFAAQRRDYTFEQIVRHRPWQDYTLDTPVDSEYLVDADHNRFGN